MCTVEHPLSFYLSATPPFHPSTSERRPATSELAKLIRQTGILNPRPTSPQVQREPEPQFSKRSSDFVTLPREVVVSEQKRWRISSPGSLLVSFD